MAVLDDVSLRSERDRLGGRHGKIDSHDCPQRALLEDLRRGRHDLGVVQVETAAHLVTVAIDVAEVLAPREGVS